MHNRHIHILNIFSNKISLRKLKILSLINYYLDYYEILRELNHTPMTEMNSDSKT